MKEWVRTVTAWLESKKLKVFVLLALIVLLGTGLRAYDLGANPLVADEFLDMNAAYGYSQTGVWQAWDFNRDTVETLDPYPPRDERAWMYKWQVAEVFRYFAPTEAAARSVSVGWGAVTILLLYFVTRSFTGSKKIALLAAFLFAVSVTGIEFDRKLRMYAMFTPVYFALSWSLFQFLESRYRGSVRWLRSLSARLFLHPLFLFPLLTLGALSFHLQLLTINVLPVLFGYTFILAGSAIRRHAYREPSVWWLALGFLLLLFVWRFAPQNLSLFRDSIKFFMDNTEYFSMLLRDYSHPLLALLLAGIGIHFLWIKEKRAKETLWLALSWMIPLFLATFLWKRPQGLQYIFFIQPFLIILIAAGIWGTAKFFREHMPQIKQPVFAVTLALLLLLLPDYGYFFSSEDTTYRRGNSEVADYRKALAYVKRTAAPDDLIIMRNFRNYYLAGANLTVYNFGGERAGGDLSREVLTELFQKYPSGWIILFDNDQQFVSKEAWRFIEQAMTRVDTSAIRGAAKAYRWKRGESLTDADSMDRDTVFW